jgi:hypothetical protein
MPLISTLANASARGYGMFGGAAAEINSYESIATANGTGSSNIITFSSIPSTYKHLQLRWIARSVGSNGSFQTQFNSDTGSNYSYHEIYGDGSSAGAAAAAPLGWIYTGQYFNSTNMFAAGITDILDYTNTNKYKTIKSLTGRDQNGSGVLYFSSGSWRNTAAITSITLTGNGGNIDAYSSFALYGIKG